MRYRRFRSPVDLDGIFQMLRDEQTRGMRSHYTLRTLLGKAHEIKLQAWNEHKHECSGALMGPAVGDGIY